MLIETLQNKLFIPEPLISEFSLESKIEAWNFPTRNRIISGMCKGVLVVEGKRTSGALITSKEALEQNRDVFALPGNIDCPQSEGPNFLIKLGAKIVTCAEDILEEYQMTLFNVKEAGKGAKKTSKKNHLKWMKMKKKFMTCCRKIVGISLWTRWLILPNYLFINFPPSCSLWK